MHTEEVSYPLDANTTAKGFIAYQPSKNPKPAVLVGHDWSGRNDFACEKAKMLAELGYVGFALDMYGEGKLGSTTEEKLALITPIRSDRTLLQQRMIAAFNTICEQPGVDANKVAAIGYCFGGLCAIDLARSGTDLKAAISFHGLLDAPTQPQAVQVKSKVLILHGYDDGMVPPEQVITFATEMTEKNVDWQIHMYGHAKHSFSNPTANDAELGLKFDPIAEKRSWQACTNFLTEVLD